MANTDFGILLKTLLDKSGINSELEQVQKIVNKYSIDIMPELKTASLKNQMKAVSQEIANDFNKAFGTNLTGNDVFKAFENQAKQAKKTLEDQAKAAKKVAEEQAKAIEEARKAQEKHNETVRKGKELAKKQADDHFTSKQSAIYDDIKKNQSQIYSLKQKLLSADKLETEEINKQISALELKNKYNNYKLTKNGMVDNSLEKSVQESKAVLENQYKIADTRKQDNANAKESARTAKETAQAEKERLDALEKQRVATANSAKEKAKSNAQQELAQQKEINAILSKQESAYKEIWNINKQIANLDPTKNSNQISALNEKKKFYQEIYLSAQKELQAYSNITVSQEHLNSLSEIRKKTEAEISVIQGKQADVDVASKATSKEKAYQDAYTALKKLYDLRIEYAKIDNPSNNATYLYENAIKQQEKVWRKAYANTSEPENWDMQKRLELERQEIAMQEKLAQAYGRVTEAKKQAEKVDKIQLSWSDGSYEAKYDSLIAKTRQWVDANDESVISTQKLTTAYNEFNQAASNFAKDGSVKNRDILIQKEEELGRQLKSTTNDIKVQNAEWAKSSKVDSLHQKIQEFYDKNTATHRTWGSQLKNMLNETAHGAQVTATRVNEIEQEFLGVSNAARQAGKLGQSFFGSIKEQASKFVQWFSVTSVVMEGVQAIKKMTQEVIAVDSAMVELRKVSDVSNNDLKNYFDEATKSAKDLGATISDVISATADWSRLGYSLDDSKKLAEVAILYKNVGDGIDVDTANESLVSTLRGFQLSAEDAMNIVDQFNEVANNFPIDSAGIGEALQRSAASFYEANTDLSKSIALITGTNSVIQDPDSVGTMWKTVSMRIRGATAELEEAGLETEGMVETTSQLQALVKGMTGFDIMKDEDTFKDIYEIVIGIGNEWQNLSDIEQSSLLEALAGKRQGNALAAALNNISMIEDAYNTATNSAGSALEEQEEYEKGIQYSLDRLEAKFQEFSNHVLESELIKGIVDFGTTTLEVVDKVTSALGSLGTIGVIGGGILGAKNAGKCRMSVRISNCFEYALHA